MYCEFFNECLAIKKAGESRFLITVSQALLLPACFGNIRLEVQ
jgi:hypothetical protein